MNESFTILNRNFYDMVAATPVQDVYLGDYGVYLGQQSAMFWKDVLTPPVEHYTDKVYGQNGAYHFGSVFPERNLRYPCYVKNVDENTLRDIQQILTLTTPHKMILDEHVYRYIWVTCTEQIDFDLIRANGYSGLFVVTFTAYDPFWYSYYSSLDTYNTYDYRSIYSNLGVLPLSVPSCTLTSITSNTTFTLLNHGNTNSKLIIGMVGSGTNIVVINTSMSKSFTISSMSSENILVDATRGSITNGVITNGVIGSETAMKTSKFTGVFLELQPGLNYFSLTGTGLNLSSVQFLYRHTYV